MTVFVALLRGINVGGKHSLPMQALRDMLGSLGCEDVKTYIQSGNAVFRASNDRDQLAADIKAAIDKQFGFAPIVHLLTFAEFELVLASNPFPDAVEPPKCLHVSFLLTSPENPDLDTLEALRSPTERFELGANAFYLHAPDGIARSKLAAKADKCLGVQTTSRNWRTVSKIAELALFGLKG